MPYPQADPGKLRMQSVYDRISKNSLEQILNLAQSPTKEKNPDLIRATAEHIRSARKNGASVMLAFGAHLIKNGCGPHLIQLLQQGWITHLATQGAGCIHDWELAFMGRTEEDVRANAATGTFGIWDETGRTINLAVQAGALHGMGFGESLGALIQRGYLNLPDPEVLKQEIIEGLEQPTELLAAKAELYHTMVKFRLAGGRQPFDHKHKEHSILATAFRLGIPVTVHPGIGYDIIFNNPYANGGALGRAAHVDYHIFVNSVLNLSGGVFLSIGSAIMAPQVFEKAFSFANNLLLQKGGFIKDHYILVDDLQASTWDWQKGEPPKTSPDYYLRFLKSFSRMGGIMRYASIDNRSLLHGLADILRA